MLRLGTWPALWIPWVVAAHMCAAYLIIKTNMVMHPSWRETLRHLTRQMCCALKKQPPSLSPRHDGSVINSIDTVSTNFGQDSGPLHRTPSSEPPSHNQHIISGHRGSGLLKQGHSLEAPCDEDHSFVGSRYPSVLAGTLSADIDSISAMSMRHAVRKWRSRHSSAAEDIPCRLLRAGVGPGGGISQPSPHRGPDLAIMRRNTNRMQPMNMEWRDLGCSYDSGSGVKTILQVYVHAQVYSPHLSHHLHQGVSGHVGPGDMLALMGPSGAGKSTLLDILAARKTVGNLTGVVLVNGQPRTPAFVSRSAYVPQDDNFLPVLRAEETLQYYASLVLPNRTCAASRQERVMEVLAAVGLAPHRMTLVGGHLPGGLYLRGLSGGERKRLSVAAGIIGTPSTLFLDEPTSGLDSFAALSVMEYLRAMADTGHTVLASIHQPRSAIWNLFTKAVVLSMGRLMYFGPRDSLIPWFSEVLGYEYDPELHGVATDWAMDLVNIGFKKPKRYYGRMMTTDAQLKDASDRFVAFYHECSGRISIVRRHTTTSAARKPSTPPRSTSEWKQFAVHLGSGETGSAGMGGAASYKESGGDSNGGQGGGGDSAGGIGSGTGGGISDKDVVGAASCGDDATDPSAKAGDVSVGASVTPVPGHGAATAPFEAPTASHTATAPSGPSRALMEGTGTGEQHTIDMPSADNARLTMSQLGTDFDKITEDANSGYNAGTISMHRASWLRQLRVLMWREYLNITRNPADVAGRMLIFCWVGIVLGLCFWNVTPAFEGLRARLNLMFITDAVLMLLPFVYMSLYTADKQYYLADVSARLFSPSAYYIARTLVLLPFSIINTLAFAYTAYGMAGLRHSPGAVAAHGLCVVLGYLIASQVLYLAAVLTPNQDMAFMVAIAWTAINILWSNFLNRYQDMTWRWMQYLKYLSAMAYTFEGMLNAEVRDVQYDCQAGFQTNVVQFIPKFLPQTPAASSKYFQNLLMHPPADCSVNLDVILDYFGFVHPIGITAAILVGYLLVVHILSYLALLLMGRKERR